MAEEKVQVLILRDQQGIIYEIPHDTLAASKVPASRLPALQQTLDAEVSGYLFAPAVQNEIIPSGQHAAGLGGPTFIGGLTGLNGPFSPAIQNDFNPR